MRRRPSEVDLRRRRSAERLMRAEVRVVDETHLDLLQQVFRHQRPEQAKAERVLQRPPESLDQGDRALFLPTAVGAQWELRRSRKGDWCGREGERREPRCQQNASLAGRNRGNRRTGPRLLGEIAPGNSHCAPTPLVILHAREEVLETH